MTRRVRAHLVVELLDDDKVVTAVHSLGNAYGEDEPVTATRAMQQAFDRMKVMIEALEPEAN